MKKKKIWIFIACFALLICSLAVLSFSGNKEGKTDSDQPVPDESTDLELPEIEILDGGSGDDLCIGR